MKKILAIALLCSTSTFLGFFLGGSSVWYTLENEKKELREMAEYCQEFELSIDSSQIVDRIMFVTAMTSDNQELHLGRKEAFIEKLSNDLLQLQNEINKDLSDLEIKRKKELVLLIQEVLAEENPDQDS